MKFCIIRYAKSCIYIILFPIGITIALVIAAVNVLIEKVSGSKEEKPPTSFYQLTSWEEE